MKQSVFFIILIVVLTACGTSEDDTQIESVGNEKYQSPYLEEVNLPLCDETNPEVHFIFNESDLSELNNPEKRIFCIKPGDYSLNGREVLTQSGTSDNPRYLVLDNGNDIHPGKLDKSQLAKLQLRLENTDYWIIDRLSYWDSDTTLNPLIINNSDHNIINRYFMDNVGNGIYFYPNSDFNTIQNSRIQRTEFSLKFDRAAIGINSNSHYNEFTLVSSTNNKILNNEIYNFVDGFQSIRSSWYEDGRVDENNKSIVVISKNINYEGTIVDNNHFYIDNTVYTDCNGNHDPLGTCAYAENGIDLKVGSDNPNNPMIISNNKMWGFRKSDTTDSDLGDPGAVMPIHYGVYNTIIKNNLSFNSTVGFAVNNPESNEFSMSDSKIIDNIFVDIKDYGLYFGDTKNIIIENNLLKDFPPINSSIWGSQFWLFDYGNKNLTFSNNTTTNVNNRSARVLESENSSYINNDYFEALPGEIPASGGQILLEDPSDSYKDLVFTTDTFTNFPREITISKVLKD